MRLLIFLLMSPLIGIGGVIGIIFETMAIGFYWGQAKVQRIGLSIYSEFKK